MGFRPLSPKKKRMGFWSDLPSELLAIICEGLEDPCDVRRVRSVCRTWRSSVAPPARIFSVLFPHRISVSPPPFTAPEDQHRPIDLFSKAVYLLRHHSDPSKVWMVSMEEANAGKLRLRHPVTCDPLVELNSPGELLSTGWSVTEIARSHRFCFADDGGTAQVLGFDYWWNHSLPDGCTPDTKLATLGKVILYSNNAKPNPTISDFTAVVLFGHRNRVCSFRLMGGGGEEVVEEPVLFWTEGLPANFVDDVVNFNGGVYAIDYLAHVYLVEPYTLRVKRIDDTRFPMPRQVTNGRKRLLVSNGELYMVSKFYVRQRLILRARTCVVHKLVGTMDSFYRWELVENLGDQVFFISVDCSYSVPARDLPYPWRGNCVVFDREALSRFTWDFICPKYNKQIDIFHLDGQQDELSPISSYHGYSDLFTPLSTRPIRRCPNMWKRASQSQGSSDTTMKEEGQQP